MEHTHTHAHTHTHTHAHTRTHIHMYTHTHTYFHLHSICLAHNRSQALGKLLRFCRCIDLLPAESIVSLLKAIAARKLDTSLFGLIVHHAQREQIKAVDSNTWSELLEVLCSLNHIRDIKVGISICSQNSVQINNKVRSCQEHQIWVHSKVATQDQINLHISTVTTFAVFVYCSLLKQQFLSLLFYTLCV